MNGAFRLDSINIRRAPLQYPIWNALASDQLAKPRLSLHILIMPDLTR